MKNIIITTFHRAHNYGAALQAYAIERVLEDHGYNVSFLNYKHESIEKPYRWYNINNTNILKFIKSIIRSIQFFPINYPRYRAFTNFRKLYLKHTEIEYNSESEVKNNYPEADVYIVGSDQVWNSSITNGLSDIYTLNFGNSTVKRISYAASIGNNKINGDEIDSYKFKLAKLDYISVREETAKELLDALQINDNINVALDPTLLLHRHDWEQLTEGMPAEKEKYILAYVVENNEQYIKIVNYLSNLTGLKIIHFDKCNTYNNTLKSAYTKGPLEFINLIKNAEYVVATSFHATVFSIIYGKKFWIVPHLKTGSRVTDILDKFSIINRAVYTMEDFIARDYDEEINYNQVYQMLEKERQRSINWLIQSIEG